MKYTAEDIESNKNLGKDIVNFLSCLPPGKLKDLRIHIDGELNDDPTTNLSSLIYITSFLNFIVCCTLIKKDKILDIHPRKRLKKEFMKEIGPLEIHFAGGSDEDTYELFEKCKVLELEAFGITSSHHTTYEDLSVLLRALIGLFCEFCFVFFSLSEWWVCTSLIPWCEKNSHVGV